LPITRMLVIPSKLKSETSVMLMSSSSNSIKQLTITWDLNWLTVMLPFNRCTNKPKLPAKPTLKKRNRWTSDMKLR
jgi:hypothetical protein